MTKKIKTENNMSSSGLTRRSRNKDFMCLLDARSGSGMTSARGESGRSMVEMLGTLAIIGVLSVGGIAGYTYGMNKYYANEILAGASARAVIVASQLASGRELSLSEFDKMENAGGEFDGTVEIFDDGFGMKVSAVKESVCKNIVKSLMDTNIVIAKDDMALTDLQESDCIGDSNEFLFVFENTLGQYDQVCESNADCKGGASCQKGQCVCPNGKVLAFNAGSTIGFDFPMTCCNADKVIGGICCNSVKEENGLKSCCIRSSSCCPKGYFYSPYDNTCHSCDEEGNVPMGNGNSSSFCRVCPNRVSLFTGCLTECPNPEMIKIDQNCTCPLEKPYQNITTNECLSLSELTLDTNYFINNRYRQDANGKLIYDDSIEWICRPLKDNPNTGCSGAYMSTCPSDKIDILMSAKCQTCEEVDMSAIKFQSQCEFCNGTWTGDNWFTGTCIP